MIKKHQRFFNMMLFILDACTLSMTYVACYLFKTTKDPLFQPDFLYLKMLSWILPLMLLVYFFMELYSPMRSIMFRKEVILIVRAHVVGLVMVYSVFYIAKLSVNSREILFSFGILGLLFILLERNLVRRTLRYLRKIGYNQKHLLVVGAGNTGRVFARKVHSHREFGYNVVGFLDDAEDKLESGVLGRPVLGRVDSLPDILTQQKGIDEVVIALPLFAYQKYGKIIDCCEKEGVRVRIVFDHYNLLPSYPKIEDFDGIPLLNTRHVPLDDPLNRFLKRILDIVVSSIAVFCSSPLMIAIAVGIKLTSRGPIFFKQERIGLNNRSFQMLKFRSMRVDDDRTASVTWTTVHDPRKTRFGSFLRKTSLDELPQFFNVLFGDMSVVGPRPERPFFVEQFKEIVPKYMVKHQVKPGITGWAQVNGWRGDTSIERRIECDIYYIENWDLLFDIKIMFLTVFKGLVNKNAY